MDGEEAIQTTALITRNSSSAHQEMKVESDAPIRRRMHIQNNHGEHTLNLVLVVEDFRVGFYLVTLFILLVGFILTKAFTKEDYAAIITDVYGIGNACIYFDSPPSTYVLPVLCCFGVIFGFIYAVCAIFRIRIAHLENKLGLCSTVLLTLAYVYVGLSIILFMQAFAVQPIREKPESMVVHTFSYLNWNLMFAVLQVAVVWFGLKVSWVDLKLPWWFSIVSVIHAIALVITKVIAFVFILNGLLDMGEKGMEGKGFWWSVRSKWSHIFGHISVTFGGIVLGMIFPLVQCLFICRHGVNTHALVVAVSDNRPAHATLQ